MEGQEQCTGHSRREFIKKSSAVAATTAFAGFHIAGPTFGQNMDPIRVGLVGCGGRGTGAAENAVSAAPNVQVVAMGDLFQDQVDKSLSALEKSLGGNFSSMIKVDKDHQFSGFDAFKKVIDSENVNYVILATPPGFRPEHFEYAVNAGKNIFSEKPVAVDPVGCRRFMKAGELSIQKGLAVGAGLQRRHTPSYLDVVGKIQNGDIGDVKGARAYCCSGDYLLREQEPGESDMSWQIRNWRYFTWMSGDHIVENQVHLLDVCNWVLGMHPVKAFGMGGKQVLTAAKYGTIYDHFTIDYEYSNGVHMCAMSRQQNGTTRRVGSGFVGCTGEAIMYEPNLLLKPQGGKTYRVPYVARGDKPPHLQVHVALIESIRNGNPMNESKRIAEATMTGIMGRESAYTGQELTWDEVMASDLNLTPSKYEFGPGPVPVIPQPGQKR